MNERELFEADYKRRTGTPVNLRILRNGNEYLDGVDGARNLNVAWEAWQARALLSRYGRAAGDAQPIRLEHMAVADEDGLRWMSGRKMPAGVESVELYAVPGYGKAPKFVYTAPVAAQNADDARDVALPPLSSRPPSGRLRYTRKEIRDYARSAVLLAVGKHGGERC